MRRWLRRLHDDLNVTSIFVTYDQEQALEVADRVVLMNQGKVEQIGSPQEVCDHPASPFVYGFLGDVNLFHGRAHEGQVNVEGIRNASPEHANAQNARAFAYVRPYDIDVQPYTPQTAAGEGIDAKLDRAIVISPIARLELIPKADSRPAGGPLVEALIDAQLPAQQYRDLGLREGATVVLAPRKARVFVDAGEGI